MKVDIKILMIDDHPPILDGYELLLKHRKSDFNFCIDKAYSINQAIDKLFDGKTFFDLIIIDIRLPASEKHFIENGEELGLKIRKYFNSKIIILTSLYDPERIQGILKNLRPEGFMIKTQINKDTLFDCVNLVLNNKNYLCENTIGSQSILNGNPSHFLDFYDIKIIQLISKGEKLKNIPNHLPLSLSSIERRKRKIRRSFSRCSRRRRRGGPLLVQWRALNATPPPGTYIWW